ncbi:hypothetical protein LZG04_40650 [Saccharothrix sp. S26]|nr:hypothetical protein [Saccharothrix sp. S26]MCE7001086.1 hypothetical protein [Saccharothrix sp. S26]
MHEVETARAVANPRRTRLGADWTRSTEVVDRPQPGPGPSPDRAERSVG